MTGRTVPAGGDRAGIKRAAARQFLLDTACDDVICNESKSYLLFCLKVG
jgi:hypothetical protein